MAGITGVYQIGYPSIGSNKNDKEVRNTALGWPRRLYNAATSWGALVAASHEKCLLGEMVRGGLSRIERLRYVDQFQAK